MPIKKENYYLIRRHFINLFGNECAICKRACMDDGTYRDSEGMLRKMEFDHIKPNGVMRHDVGISKRTWEWFEAYHNNNLQLLCAKCNREKWDK